MSGNNQIVQLENITKVYTTHTENYAAVRDINFKAERGNLILILGPSGSGKTTLLTIMAGFLKPSAGEVHLFGKNIDDYSPRELQRLRAERIGFVFQTFLLIDTLSVYENIALVNNFILNKPRKSGEKIFAAMERVGIARLSRKRPVELSHGERQRVAIARAFMNSAELLIAD
jgi:putative ABC transport system ATP-binding protein